MKDYLNFGLEEEDNLRIVRYKYMEKNKYSISETTKEERIALIKSWIPDDEVMDGCDIDLWDMYADYINGTKEIAECNAAFKADYFTS